jgi:uncharacterized protein YecE (DUF72 family)
VSRARARLACAGWSYADWVGPFYAPGTPPSEWLRAYSRVFDSVEVDSTFYAQPSRDRVEEWARATPPGFTFAPKLPRSITHDARLRGTEDLVDSFLVALAPLLREGKLGPVVAQLPPSFRFEDHATLVGFLHAWPKDPPLAVELRHPSWWREETYETLRESGAALTWGTSEAGRAPPVRTAGFVYARLIGDRALDAQGGRWTHVQRRQTAEIEHWRKHLGEALSLDPYTVWIIANNHFEGFAPETARALADALDLLRPDIERAARPPGQRGLGDFG